MQIYHTPFSDSSQSNEADGTPRSSSAQSNQSNDGDRHGLIYFLVISLQLFDACDMLEYYVMDTISCA
jgi:hypothetical protein